MEIAKRLQGVGEYYFSKKLREIDELNRQGKHIINLGIGSPDLPPHPEVIRTLQEEAEKSNVHGYQNYKGSPVLREAFAGWYQRWYGVELNPETEVLPLIGSKEGIMHLCMTYLNEGDAALVPNPGYPTYRSNVTIAGGVCIDYELKETNDYQPDLEAIAAKDLSKVKLMFVNYPQMPTGQQPDLEVFRKLIAFAKKHGILLVHDNPYSFILNEHPVSILSIDGAREVAVELNSLSKSHNMAGWRVGVLCGAAERINEVLRFKSNMDSGMFLPLQLAAATALSLGGDWYEEVNAVYSARREKVYNLLDLLGCSYSKKQVGLFVWAAIPEGYKDGYELADAVLYNANVFITPGGIFGNAGDRYIRISLCGSVQRFEEAITRIAAQITKIRS
ncbi:aminotransferase class I/II-fold pyridoxal phosphate-dependent enzyme [Niabella sp. CC-SYL272]|uniref:pyridoxal phosphate-dependent aminotransferase n=1 Tax=Niabella agricola TaxID=2891571 RepID=UPI001F19B536|nr:aminotransferase class I/II-fold pyridoxal phosphate-dependent enzyme [Niabella agricola]MCF3108698.1 aminotransferase class I/II-fold pyridoxal phosphate-dependent enzyme [Niabella agricola]